MAEMDPTMDNWMHLWFDRDYKNKPTFITTHHFWKAAKLSLCQKYTDEPNVLSFLNNMMVLVFSNDAETNTMTNYSPFSGATVHTTSGGLNEYTVSILMKDRRIFKQLSCSPLCDRMSFSYQIVTLQHNPEKEINNIYVSDYDGDGYNMWEFYQELEDSDSLSHQERQYRMFMETLMKDEEKITHEQMSDIFQVLFDYFPVHVDF